MFSLKTLERAAHRPPFTLFISLDESTYQSHVSLEFGPKSFGFVWSIREYIQRGDVVQCQEYGFTCVFVVHSRIGKAGLVGARIV